MQVKSESNTQTFISEVQVILKQVQQQTVLKEPNSRWKLEYIQVGV